MGKITDPFGPPRCPPLAVGKYPRINRKLNAEKLNLDSEVATESTERLRRNQINPFNRR